MLCLVPSAAHTASFSANCGTPCGEGSSSLGNAYSSMRDHGRAIQDFDRAIELQPDYADARRKRELAIKARRSLE